MKARNAHGLTLRDIEIIEWASLGKTQSETAEILGISREWVGKKLYLIAEQLGTRNSAGTIGFCFRHGILTVPEQTLEVENV